MKVVLDQDKCQGHARCAILAPDVFDVDDLGKGYVVPDGGTVPDQFGADTKEAAFSCPESAISIVEE
jgi:ferredoxin